MLSNFDMRLIIILLLLLPGFITVASTVTRFDRLSLEHGLSQASVYSIVQDHQGFLWFGTEDGLNRYDGYQFKVFRHNPDDPHSISNNFINTLMIDSVGTLWIGTDVGLNRYYPDTDGFISFRHDSASPNSLSNNTVTAIVENSPGEYWIGTDDGGLNHFNQSTGQFKRYQHNTTILIVSAVTLSVHCTKTAKAHSGLAPGIAALTVLTHNNKPSAGINITRQTPVA